MIPGAPEGLAVPILRLVLVFCRVTHVENVMTKRKLCHPFCFDSELFGIIFLVIFFINSLRLGLDYCDSVELKHQSDLWINTWSGEYNIAKNILYFRDVHLKKRNIIISDIKDKNQSDIEWNLPTINHWLTVSNLFRPFSG